MPETQSATATREAEGAAWEPRILGILCYWCTYAGADLAGSSRLKQAPNVRAVRVPCSGRIDPLFVLRAFARGADAVLLSGCHPGDCHYSEGNYYCRRRFSVFKRLMEFVGIPKERFRVHWISAAEGQQFAQVVNEMTEQVRALGPFRWKAES